MTNIPPSPSRADRNARLAADAAVTAYIHEISERHLAPEPSAAGAAAPAADN